MKIFLVGGAVRDQLLGLPVHERDWVVIGSTPKDMIALGYKPVGKDFPVFLHPKTHEEYALARTERKTAKGYKGFEFYCAQDVTLEQDLERRDLTINAIAQNDQGELFDPFNGQQDLQDKIFRHVSLAFSEDPVRILRLARFACRFPSFNIAPETLKLMQKMVENKEVHALVAERVWKEFERALTYEAPKRFLDVLQQANALPILFPELSYTSAGVQAIQSASENTDNPIIRFACLFHDININNLQTINRRLKLPKEYHHFTKLMINYLTFLEKLDTTSAKQILDFLKKLDSLRRPDRIAHFMEAARYCLTQNIDIKAKLLQQSLLAIKNTDTTDLQQQGLQGQDFANALEKRYINAIESFLQ